jgi:vacuolar protein sorting-associated protein 8
MNAINNSSNSSSAQRLVSASLNHALKQISLIALSSERSSFAVAVEPKVSVLHRWSWPPKERVLTANSSSEDDSVYLPCLAWGWGLTLGSGKVALPLLARSWGCCLHLLASRFPTIEEDTATNNNTQGNNDDVIHRPAFGLHQELDAKAPIVALEWLGERSLVFLTLTHELSVVDTALMILLERLDFSEVHALFAEFALSRTRFDCK